MPKTMTAKSIKRLRLRLGWTQPQMAEYLGLRNGSQVCHLESGRTAASGPKVVLLRQLEESLKKDGKRALQR